MKSFIIWTALFVAALFLIFQGEASASEPEIRLSGDRLSLRAQGVPLQTILRRLMDLNIRVRIDPGINPEISISLIDMEIGRGLSQILRPLDHALIWTRVEGPGGLIQRLSEIQVFRPGERWRMQPLEKKRELALSRNPKDGSWYVRNEILLSLGPNMGMEEFRRLLQRIGGTLIEGNASSGIFRILVPEGTDIPSFAETVLHFPGVARAEPNFAYPLQAPSKAEGDFSSNSGTDLLRPMGRTPIAVLDSGLIPGMIPDEYVTGRLDALTGEFDVTDSLGHGTQMALIASGIIKPLGSASGSANRYPIVPIRAFDDNGYTSNYAMLRSIDYALNQGARVMSLSWGSETKSAFLEQALEQASARGLIIVASAGNEPTGKPVYPAAYKSVVAVGALTPEGKSWEKSNYGNFVKIYAPGFASLPVGYKGEPGSYAGTSISAAYTANVIAEYISKNPNASLPEILEGLQKIESKKN